VSGWRRSVCDCGCGDPSVCAAGGCGRCLSDDPSDPNISCGDGSACPATYAVTVNVPSITLEKSTWPYCDTMTFSAFTVYGVFTMSNCSSGGQQFIGSGGGSQTISGDDCPVSCVGQTIDYIGVWCRMGFNETTSGEVRGRGIYSDLQLRLHYDGAYHDSGCGFADDFWNESGVTSPTFIAGCGCLNGYTGEFTKSRTANANFCLCWTSAPVQVTVDWSIS